MAGLTDTLELDFADAMRGIDAVESGLTSAFTSAAQSFKVGLADALSLISQVEVSADAGPVTSAITDAVAAADAVVPVEADAGGVAEAIDSAVADADTTVPLDADTGDLASISGEISGAVADADTTVTVEADTQPAVDAVADLGAESASTTEALGGVTVGSRQLAAAAGLAAGEVGNLTDALPDVGTFTTVAGGLAAITVAATASFRAAEESEVADRRFASSLGDLADQINQVNVGGLTGDLTALATQAGSSDERLKLAVGRIGELGASAGAAGPQIVTTAQNIEALALRASVVNPTLGEAGDIADRLTTAFARGGRALAPYGIALQSTEINARALADTGKAAEADLTLFDKSAAGSALAVERLGSSLGTDFQSSLGQTVVQVRSVRQEFDNALEVIGQPLLAPVAKEIRENEPLLVDLATDFADAAEAVLPLAGALLHDARPALHGAFEVVEVFLPVLNVFASVLESISGPVLEAAGVFLTLRAGMRGLNTVFDNAASSALMLAGRMSREGLAGALGGLASPVGLATFAIAGLVAVIASSSAAVAKEKAATREFTAELAKQETTLTDLTQKKLDDALVSRNQVDDLNRLGLTVEDVRKFALDGADGYAAFLDTMASGGQISRRGAEELTRFAREGKNLADAYNLAQSEGGILSSANFGLIKTFVEVQKTAQEAAQGVLTQAEAHGRLSEEQIKASEAQHRLIGGSIDYQAVLNDLLPVQIKAADGTTILGTHAEQAAQQVADYEKRLRGLATGTDALAIAASKTGPGLRSVTDQFLAGTLTGSEFDHVLKTTNVSADELFAAFDELQGQAKAFTDTMGTPLTRALDQAGPALGAVIARSVDGKLTFGQFQNVLGRTHLSTEELSSALATARSSVDAFVTGVTGKLPTVQSAFDDLGDNKGLDEFLKNITTQAKDAAQFIANIGKLEARGADDLASSLLQQGPAAATAAAQAAKLGDKALASRESQLDKGLASEGKTNAKAAALAKKFGLDMLGIQTNNVSLLAGVKAPDLTKPILGAMSNAHSAAQHAAHFEDVGAQIIETTVSGFTTAAPALFRAAEFAGRQAKLAEITGIERTAVHPDPKVAGAVVPKATAAATVAVDVAGVVAVRDPATSKELQALRGQNAELIALTRRVITEIGAGASATATAISSLPDSRFAPGAML